MEIPSVTESQVELMRQVCHDPEMSVFSQCSVKPEDPLQAAVHATQARKDAEALVILGFLKNITANHQERINEMNQKTDRSWEVYEITAMGRAMFQAATPSAIN
jgi:hypothetical protein